jgi:hypothetical protein
MKPAGEVEEDGNKALAHNCATTMAVHGFGEKDIHLVGVILAAKGHYTLNMRYTAPMGMQDLGGEKYHPGDWGSNDGVTKKKAEHWLAVRIHTTKAALRNLIIAMDPLVAWNEVKHCEHTVKFLGGERNKPRDDHGVLSFAMGRAPVGGGSWEPSYPAAFRRADKFIQDVILKHSVLLWDVIFAIYFGMKKPIRHRGRHPTGGYIPNGEHSRVAPQLGGRHKTWTDRRTKNRRQHPTGRKSPNGAQSATQSDMGADLGESPGHANEVEAFD